MMKVINLKNKGLDTLEEIIDNVLNDGKIRCIELYLKNSNYLYSTSVENGKVDDVEELKKVFFTHGNVVIENYAITGCNFQAIV